MLQGSLIKVGHYTFHVVLSIGSTSSLDCVVETMERREQEREGKERRLCTGSSSRPAPLPRLPYASVPRGDGG